MQLPAAQIQRKSCQVVPTFSAVWTHAQYLSKAIALFERPTAWDSGQNQFAESSTWSLTLRLIAMMMLTSNGQDHVTALSL